MRTRPLANLRRSISEINRYVTVSLFFENQFFEDNNDKIRENQRSYTSKVFEENDYSHKHNVELGKLNEDSRMYESYLMSTSYVFLYSSFEIYIKEVGKYVRRVMGRDFTVDKYFFIGDLFDKIGKDLNKSFVEDFTKTVKYVRLRRNTHVHSDGSPSECLKKLIRYKGSSINEYWSRELNRGLLSLDFGDFSTDEFSFEELVDLIRIMRRVSTKVDQKVIEYLGEDKIIKYLYGVFKDKHKNEIDNWKKYKLERKLSGFVEREIGIPRKQFGTDLIDDLGT